jgi:hypothetical protein
MGKAYLENVIWKIKQLCKIHLPIYVFLSIKKVLQRYTGKLVYNNPPLDPKKWPLYRGGWSSEGVQ